MAAAGQENSRKRKVRGDESATVDSSATLLWQLPKNRLQGLVEALEKSWDEIATDDFGKEELCRLVYVLSGVKGNLGISGYRAMPYERFFEKMATAQRRYINDISNCRYDQIIAALTPLTIQKVMVASDRCGFDKAWMERPKKGKAKATARPPALADANRQPAKAQDEQWQDVWAGGRQPSASVSDSSRGSSMGPVGRRTPVERTKGERWLGSFPLGR